MSARLPLMMLEVAKACGADAEALAKEAGLDRPEMREPDARVPIELENHLWELAASRVGDPVFGLRAGLLYQPGQLEAFDYVCLNAPTLRELLRAVIRYNRLLHDVAEYSLEERGTSAFVSHGFRAGIPGPSWHAVDFVIGSGTALLRSALGRALPLRAVGFAHAEPRDIRPYAERLNIPKILFDQDRTWIELDARLLDERLPQANPGLWKVLSRHAEALLSELPQADSFVTRLREVLAAQLKHGMPALADVAAQLHMSPRTLQRRLGEENLSFKDEVDELRRGLALRYVRDKRMSLAEVAFLLGYSEARAFHRAFKSWTGETPGEVRRRLAG